MTINDAIKCARERAESWKLNREDCDFNNACSECATACEAEEKDNEQLAEWLEELKRLRQATEQDVYERAYAEGRDKGYSCGEFNGYNKAIDEFFNELQKYEETDDWLRLKMSSIYEIAEQLKLKNNDL